MGAIKSIGDFCQDLGLNMAEAHEFVDICCQKSFAEWSVDDAAKRSHGGRAHVCLPLVEVSENGRRGEAWGEVEARIPKREFWRLAQDKGFGWEGLTSDDGLKDILRDMPHCRVQTVSGRIQSGWTAGRKVVKNYGQI